MTRFYFVYVNMFVGIVTPRITYKKNYSLLNKWEQLFYSFKILGKFKEKMLLQVSFIFFSLKKKIPFNDSILVPNTDIKMKSMTL